MIAVGITDFITIAGGISLFPGSSSQLLYFAPKVTVIQNDSYAISLGDFFVKYPETDDYLNIVYTVGTITANQGAFTLGIGYETNSKEPMILLGGELRVSSHAKLITENWFVANSEFQVLSFGIRFLGKHLAADFAFLSPIGVDDVVFIPWIGFAYNF